MDSVGGRGEGEGRRRIGKRERPGSVGQQKLARGCWLGGSLPRHAIVSTGFGCDVIEGVGAGGFLKLIGNIISMLFLS